MADRRVSQVLAINSQVRATYERVIDPLYKAATSASRTERFAGARVAYRALIEGEIPPPDAHKPVEIVCAEQLPRVREVVAALTDNVATRDFGNTVAQAPVVVDGEEVLAHTPAATLLFLENELGRLVKLLRSLPVPSPDKRWREQGADGLFESEPEEQRVQRKMTRPVVLAEATEHHKAQVQAESVDVIYATKITTYLSGGLSLAERERLARRAERLQAAVKQAREEANTTVIAEQTVGTTAMAWVFAGD